MFAQIPLPFGRFDRFNFEQYWSGPNREPVTYLQQSVGSLTATPVYLWGEKGTGRSHLLQATCTLAASQKKKVIYIPLEEKSQFNPEMLGGMESLDIVCLDDIGAIAGEYEWEVAIFNLYNGLIAGHRTLIVAADCAPAALPIQLADLKSRLSAGVTWHLQALEEKDRLLALRQRAHARGFELPDEVMEYLTRRVARDMHSLFAWLDKLDHATLVSKKKLTVPFVRELIEQ